jgi:hypothetical protein
MDVLQHCGFSKCDWVWALLSSYTSRVLLNSVACDPIKHDQGLRQGDPLSRRLLVLAIDPINHVLANATSQGRLHTLHGRANMARTSQQAWHTRSFCRHGTFSLRGDHLGRKIGDASIITGSRNNIIFFQLAHTY